MNWLDNLFASIDDKDAEGFASFLAHDAIFKFGNAEAVAGKAAIQEAVAAFFAGIQDIRHELLDSWSHPHAVVCRGTATYTRHDGSRLTVPFANVLKMQGSLIREYLVYVDISELYRTGSA